MVLALGGCASPPSDTQAYIHSVQASDDYRKGYTDGCETANLAVKHAEAHRDDAAFTGDAEYRLGWVAGQDKCKDVQFVKPSTPSIRSYN